MVVLLGRGVCCQGGRKEPVDIWSTMFCGGQKIKAQTRPKKCKKNVNEQVQKQWRWHHAAGVTEVICEENKPQKKVLLTPSVPLCEGNMRWPGEHPFSFTDI